MGGPILSLKPTHHKDKKLRPTPPPFTVVQKKINIFFPSTLTKVTIQRFTSMLVAMGGVNCKFVFFGSEPFFFLASSFCHEFPGNPGHLLINVEILFFSR